MAQSNYSLILRNVSVLPKCHKTYKTMKCSTSRAIRRMVGGMPLGIILAAVWIELLSPAAIADELRRGFDLLETEMRDLPERQRNMRASFWPTRGSGSHL